MISKFHYKYNSPCLRIMRAEICLQEIYRSFAFTGINDDDYITTEI